jgi:hypothetical protein
MHQANRPISVSVILGMATILAATLGTTIASAAKGDEHHPHQLARPATVVAKGKVKLVHVTKTNEIKQRSNGYQDDRKGYDPRIDPKAGPARSKTTAW